MWGAIGFGFTALLTGAVVDLYSIRQEEKNYTPAYVIALTCFLVDIFVTFKMEAS